LSGRPEPPALEALRARLDEEEAAYADVLAAIDRLCAFPLPAEAAPEIHDRLVRLNELWPAPERPRGGGLGGVLRLRAWDAVAPALERQAAFNAALVQLVNAYLAQADGVHARLRELAGAVVRYAQRVQPLVDARDRVATALVTTRSELLLEAFDRRLESLGQRLEGRLEGLLALRDRLEVVSEEVGAVRAALAAAAPPPAVAAAAARAAADSVYSAFENRYRGGRDEIRRRVLEYADRLAGCDPVVDLGCGRGELLEALRERGIAARGVEGNARAARECRERGLDVVEGDLVDYLRGASAGSLGAVVAVQVAEHLPPPVLSAMLAETHRALRGGGLLLLETVNPRSVLGLLEVYNRDLTHERPLHPDTLSFLAAAAGFSDVRVEMRTPVRAEDQLQPVPSGGLPPDAVAALNENVAQLNALLYGPLEYALVARR
jgi:O-antigen chain-terminating methyltransferase